VGNVTFNGTTVTVDNFNETISSTTYYYYLVADVIGLSNGYNQFSIQYGSNLATDVNGTNYSTAFYNGQGYNINASGSPTAFTINNLTTNVLASSTILSGSTNLKLFQYSVTNNTGSSLSIASFKVNSSASDLSKYLTSVRLYTNTSNTFPGSSTATATLTNSPYASFTGLSETIAAGATKYYWVVANASFTGTLPFDLQLKFLDSQSQVAVTTSSSATYNSFNALSNTYNLNTAVLSITSQQNGLSGTTVYAGQTALGVFGFGISATSGSATINTININSDNGSLSSYYSNFKLYSSTTNNYATSTTLALVGSGTVNGSFVGFTGLSQSITSTAKYYFLVADVIGSTNNTTFKFTSGQASAALIQTTPSTSYNNFSVNGSTYAITAPTVTYAMNTTGGVPGNSTFTTGQTGLLIFGFKVTVTGVATVNSLTLTNNASGTLSTFFGTTGKLYRNSGNDYSTGTNTLVGTVTINASSVVITGINSTISNTSQTFYLVVDDVYYGSTGSFQPIWSGATSTGGTTNPNQYGSTYQFAPSATTISVTGVNSAVNGITQGSLSYGQTGIVLFGFKVDVTGVYTLNQINIPSNVGANNFFANGKIYRSTDQYFAHATQITGTVTFSGSTNVTGMSQSFPTYLAPTTYYYFIVGDLTATRYFTPGTFQYNFTSGTTSFIQTSPYKDFNTPSTSNGNVFNVVKAYIWKGTTSNDFSLPANFTDLQGYGVSSIGTDVTIEIGVEAYTNAPTISGATTIGGLTFGTHTPPTITLASGASLTLNNTLSIINGGSATITGPSNSSVNLGASAVSGLTGASTLTLAGGTTLNNAGTFDMESKSVVNFTGNSKLANTGTFILRSDENGSATFGKLSGTSSITGTFKVERYFTGGQSYSRGYRLLSSPVSVSSASKIIPNLTYIKDQAWVTGSGAGFNSTGNPTLYLYRENMAPNYATFFSGNYRGIASINNTSTFTVDGDAGTYNIPAGNGFLFFFRGGPTTTNPTVTTSTAQTATFSDAGYVNQGDITVSHWTGVSGKLLYTTATANSVVRGYNLVGNPYPSSIDWDTFGTGIVGTNISNTIYIYNPKLKAYAVYIQGGGGVGTNFNGTGANIIPSGQGFFVVATAANPVLKFTEAAKVNTQVAVANLLMDTPDDKPEPIAQSSVPEALMSTPEAVDVATSTATTTTTAVQYARLQLTKDKEPNTRDEALIFFKSTAKPQFVKNEDAQYLIGNSLVNLSTKSSDNKNLAINKIAYPTTSLTIPLNVKIYVTGLYQLKLSELKNVPATYSIWLMDKKKKKDSLDIRTNKTYNFNASTTDTTTYASRFTLVIRAPKPLPLKLVTFTAAAVTAGAELTWTTQNEAATTSFTIERSINNGKTWDIIGGLISSSKGKYSLIDRFPIIGVDKYRLKLRDAKGVITYSAIKTLTFSKQVNSTGSNVSVYPNPATTTINVAVVAQQNAKSYTVRITGGNGSLLRSGTTTTTLWQSTITTLLPGTYFVQVINNTNKAVVGNGKFVKN
jgi:hypothetical protein